MNPHAAAPFDIHLLDHPPGTSWPAWLATVAATVGLGISLSVLTVLYPLVGVGATVGLCALLLVVRVPEVLLVLYAFALGVPYQVKLVGLPVNAADALLVLLCACIPLILLLRGPHPWRVPFIVKAVLPFVIAVLLSVLVASDPPGQYKQFVRVVQWFVVLPLAFCVFRPTGGLLRLLAILLMLVPCAFAIDGVVEYFNHGNSISHMIGIPVPAPEDTSAETIHHTFDVSGRAGSTFGGAQGLAIFTAMLMGAAVAQLVRGPRLRMLAVVSLAICCAGLFVAQSRGGAMGALIAVLIVAALQMPAIGRLVAVLAALAVAVGVVVLALWPGWDGSIVSLVPGGRGDAVADRLAIWRTAVDVWWEHPIFGVGLGNFRDHALRREIGLLVPLGYESFHAHNTYIELLVDTGLVGLLSYLGFLVSMVIVLLRRWRLLRNDPTSSQAATLTMAAIASLGAYVVFATVDMLLLENTHMLLVLILSAGLLAVPTRLANRDTA